MRAAGAAARIRLANGRRCFRQAAARQPAAAPADMSLAGLAPNSANARCSRTGDRGGPYVEDKPETGPGSPRLILGRRDKRPICPAIVTNRSRSRALHGTGAPDPAEFCRCLFRQQQIAAQLSTVSSLRVDLQPAPVAGAPSRPRRGPDPIWTTLPMMLFSTRSGRGRPRFSTRPARWPWATLRERPSTPIAGCGTLPRSVPRTPRWCRPASRRTRMSPFA